MKKLLIIYLKLLMLSIYPTLLDLCGLPIYDRNEGVNLVPIMRSEQTVEDFTAITTFGMHNHGLRTAQFRYIQYEDGGEAYPELITNQKSLKEWQDKRFGMFIHWGPVTLRGTEISWSRGLNAPNSGNIPRNQVAIDDYDALYKEFNPVLFDAEKWVSVAKQAGMKYIVLTTRHHDGFSLWDTKYSDYNIMNSPYGKDVVKALSEECKQQDISFGVYYSICDWYNPDYPLSNIDGEFSNPEDRNSDSVRLSMVRYNKFMKNQLKELIQYYDPFLIWFDGEWEWPWTHEMGMDLYANLRGLKDELLINNRVDKGRQGFQGMTVSNIYAGDFGTPEQNIGNFDIVTPWESCITIGEQWSWKPNDKLKTAKECIHTLLKTVGGNGNLLLNIGPMPDGRIEQRQIEILQEMGNWLKNNGEAVYGTRGGPYMPTENFVCTHNNKRIYIHILKEPERNIVKLPIPERTKLEKAFFLSNNEEIKMEFSEGFLTLYLPQQLPDKIASVIVLETNINTEKIEFRL